MTIGCQVILVKVSSEAQGHGFDPGCGFELVHWCQRGKGAQICQKDLGLDLFLATMWRKI